MSESTYDLLKYTYEMFRPPKAQTVSEWADENRILTSETSAQVGRWHTDAAPYQREIMDAFTDPKVSEIVVMASAQVGKSEIELNMLGRAIDLDPGPMLYVQPTEKNADDYSKRRIAPMIKACPRLRQKVAESKGRDSGNTISTKMFPGGSLAIIGSNSPSDLASKPIRYIFFDEIDRYPASAGAEGDPIELAERRTETFKFNRKIVKTSTPTLKGKSKIEKAYRKGTQEEWHTQCPYCHEFSFIRFDHIRYDAEEIKDEDGEKNWIIRNTMWECPICQRTAPEHVMKRQPAKWVVKNQEAIANGVRSFKLTAFMSPWSSWDEIVLRFLQAGNDPELLKTFYNTRLGETWELSENTGDPERLHDRREHYDSEVPKGVLVLTMGVDTQDNRLEYEVVGWDENEQSWGIARGVIPGKPDSPGVWEDLDALLDKEWELKNGMRLRILATFIDSGGHYTKEVYQECDRRRNRRVFAIKGEAGEGKEYVRQMKVTGRSAGAIRFLIAVDSGKTAIMSNSQIEDVGPRYMHFPIDPDAGYGMEFFKGLMSEKLLLKKRNGQNVMVWVKIVERNEPLDCRNYARAAYKFFRWDFQKMRRLLEGESAQYAQRQTAAAPPARPRQRRISRGVEV